MAVLPKQMRALSWNKPFGPYNFSVSRTGILLGIGKQPVYGAFGWTLCLRAT